MRIYYLEREDLITDFTDVTTIANKALATNIQIKSSKYDYYVLQLAVVESYNIDNVEISMSALRSGDKTISGAVTCFNKTGISYDGEKFKRRQPCYEEFIQPLFFGFDLTNASAGDWTCELYIERQRIVVHITVSDEPLFDSGAERYYSLSRLKWLNSNLYRDGVANGYIPIITDGAYLNFYGKKVLLASDGLPRNVFSSFDKTVTLCNNETKLFYKDIEFIIDDITLGPKFKINTAKMISGDKRNIQIRASRENQKLDVNITGNVRYEGSLLYVITIKAKEDSFLNDIALVASFAECKYAVGLGNSGGLFAETNFKWDANNRQDSVFIGDVHCGACFKFKAENYCMPLPDEHYSKKPIIVPVNTWHNHGLGGITLKKTASGAVMKAYTGRIVLLKGKELKFKFEMHLTPFKPLNIGGAFAKNSSDVTNTKLPLNRLFKYMKYQKTNCMILSHGIKELPYTNSPLNTVNALKQATMAAHKNGIDIVPKFSAGIISSYDPSIYPFVALSDEIIFSQDNKCPYIGYRDLPTKSKEPSREYLYLSQPASRIENYYIEIVKYLVENCLINGLSIVSTALTRYAAERIYKALTCNSKCPTVLELDVFDSFTKEYGYSSMLSDAIETLPFFTRLAITNIENGNIDPDHLLVTYSGLMYGITAESVCDNWNTTIGMLFGIRPRHGLIGAELTLQTDDIIKITSRFTSKETKLFGYWNDEQPVISDNSNILVSTYLNGENALIVAYNNSNHRTKFSFSSNGFTTAHKKMQLPHVHHIQRRQRVNFNNVFDLKEHTGMFLLILDKKHSA